MDDTVIQRELADLRSRVQEAERRAAEDQVVMDAMAARALAAEAEAKRLRQEATEDRNRLADSRDEARAEAKRLREALRLLLTEVEESGNGNAKDFGWPKALDAARAALKEPGHE